MSKCGQFGQTFFSNRLKYCSFKMTQLQLVQIWVV